MPCSGRIHAYVRMYACVCAYAITPLTMHSSSHCASTTLTRSKVSYSAPFAADAQLGMCTSQALWFNYSHPERSVRLFGFCAVRSFVLLLLLAASQSEKIFCSSIWWANQKNKKKTAFTMLSQMLTHTYKHAYGGMHRHPLFVFLLRFWFAIVVSATPSACHSHRSSVLYYSSI